MINVIDGVSVHGRNNRLYSAYSHNVSVGQIFGCKRKFIQKIENDSFEFLFFSACPYRNRFSLMTNGIDRTGEFIDCLSQNNIQKIERGNKTIINFEFMAEILQR